MTVTEIILQGGTFIIGFIIIPLIGLTWKGLKDSVDKLTTQLQATEITLAVNANTVESFKEQVSDYMKVSTEEMKNLIKNDGAITLLDKSIKNLESKMEIALALVRKEMPK